MAYETKQISQATARLNTSMVLLFGVLLAATGSMACGDALRGGDFDVPDYKKQAAQGEHDGHDWRYESARAYYVTDEKEYLVMELYPEQFDRKTLCAGIEQPAAISFVQIEDVRPKPGRYEVNEKKDWEREAPDPTRNRFNGIPGVSFMQPDTDTSDDSDYRGYPGERGFVEIVAMSDKTVTAKVVAKSNPNNQKNVLNGRFEATLCQEPLGAR